MRPRVTRPFSLSCATVFIARSIGIANDNAHVAAGAARRCSELMPTTSPFRLNSGPPELPGLTAASVWMNGTQVFLRAGRALSR